MIVDPIPLDGEILIRANDACVRLFGGTVGVRDGDAVSSCLSSHMASAGGEWVYPTVGEQAAAIIRSIVVRHPFLDGNKRTSLIVGRMYLAGMGYEWDVDPILRFAHIMTIASTGVDNPNRIIEHLGEIGPRPISDPSIVGCVIDPRLAEMAHILVSDARVLARLADGEWI